MQRKILVIDDEKDMCESIKYILEKNGYVVRFALDGKEGIAFAKEDLPDLVLLDVMMPGMDGADTMNAIRAESTLKDVPIVFLTGLVSSGDGEQGPSRINISGKECDSIPKPCDLDRLLGVISEVLNRKQ